jgi:hypothetical protein
MSFIKGKQIKDDSLDLNKIKGGSKVLPSTATLGSAKTVAEITSDNEFTTKGYVDTAVETAVVLAKKSFEMIAPSGAITYSDDLQTLIDGATAGNTIKMHKNIPIGTVITHKNGVNIDLNSFDIPDLLDSATSGKFQLLGGGRLGRIRFLDPNTDVEVFCDVNAHAVTTNLGSGGHDSEVKCKKFVMHGEIVVMQSGWFVINGATQAEFNGGGYAVEKSAEKPVASAGNNGTKYGTSSPLYFAATFTGSAFVRGAWHGNTARAVIKVLSGATGVIVFDNVTVTNYIPTGTGISSYYPQGILSDGLTKLIFRGINTLHSPNWLDFTANGSAVVEIEGELRCSHQGISNATNLTYTGHIKVESHGQVRTLTDAATIIYSLNKGRHAELTIGAGDRTFQVNHTQSIDSWNLKVLNCTGQKLSFTGIANAKYYIFGSMTEITHITLPSSGFAIIEFYKHGTDIFIKSDVTTKQYIDSAALTKHVIEVTGGTATGTGVVAYSSAITFSTKAARSIADVLVNGIQLKLTEQVFFSSDLGATRKDTPASGDVLYFDIDATAYDIDADDHIVISYFI